MSLSLQDRLVLKSVQSLSFTGRRLRNRWRLPSNGSGRVERPCLFLGDRVQVLAGEHAGKQGVLCKISTRNGIVWLDSIYGHHEVAVRGVGGMAAQKVKHYKQIPYDAVQVLDPIDGKPTAVEMRGRQRISVRSQQEIPKVENYRVPMPKQQTPFDTPAHVALEQTFDPQQIDPFLLPFPHDLRL